MVRVWVVFILLVAGTIWGIVFLLKKRKQAVTSVKAKSLSAAKPNEMWSQLYESDSLDEIIRIRLRLAEEQLDSVSYEQAKRDSQGNTPKKYGIVMPKGHLSRGQTILVRMLG